MDKYFLACLNELFTDLVTHKNNPSAIAGLVEEFQDFHVDVLELSK